MGSRQRGAGVLYVQSAEIACISSKQDMIQIYENRILSFAGEFELGRGYTHAIAII